MIEGLCLVIAVLHGIIGMGSVPDDEKTLRVLEGGCHSIEQ